MCSTRESAQVRAAVQARARAPGAVAISHASMHARVAGRAGAAAEHAGTAWTQQHLHFLRSPAACGIHTRAIPSRRLLLPYMGGRGDGGPCRHDTGDGVCGTLAPMACLHRLGLRSHAHPFNSSLASLSVRSRWRSGVRCMRCAAVRPCRLAVGPSHHGAAHPSQPADGAHAAAAQVRRGAARHLIAAPHVHAAVAAATRPLW